jgi:hypothetical protein
MFFLPQSVMSEEIGGRRCFSGTGTRNNSLGLFVHKLQTLTIEMYVPEVMEIKTRPQSRLLQRVGTADLIMRQLN